MNEHKNVLKGHLQIPVTSSVVAVAVRLKIIRYWWLDIGQATAF